MVEFIKAEEIEVELAMTLPRAFFTSQEIFEREQDRIFGARWLCAGRVESIPAAGDYFVRTLGTESVIVVRGKDGEIRGFHNTCRHRGTRICAEAAGRFSGAIRCPYHAWSYELDGGLRNAPSMEGAAEFDPTGLSLHPAPVALWEGFVFLCFGQPEQPFEESHAALIGKFTEYGLPGLRSMRRIDYDVQANWKLMFENYSECYHCPRIHPTLVRRSPADSGRNDLTAGPFLGGYMDVGEGSESLTDSGRACAIPVGDVSEANRRRVYYYAFFPNMLLSLHPDYVMVHTMWPVSPSRTLIECDWLFHPDAPAHPGFDPDDGVTFWDRTNREDWHICEQSQLGVSSRAYTPGPYSPRESLCAAFDLEVLRALELPGRG